MTTNQSPTRANRDHSNFRRRMTLRERNNLQNEERTEKISIKDKNSQQKNPILELAKENFSKINQMIENLDDPKNNLDITNMEFKHMQEEQEQTQALAKNYGKKLKTLLEKWCDSDEYKQAIEDPRLINYRNETWGDLIDFEKKLKEEMTKFHVQQEKLKHFSYSNIDWIKYKTSEYIECLETSLNEIKLHYQIKVERLQMQVEDHESRAFNVLDDNDFMKSAMEVQKEIMDTKDITNFRAAMTQLSRLKTVLQKLHKDYVKMVSQSKQMHDDVQLFKDTNELLTRQLEEQKNTNESLVDIVSNIIKTAVLYKDESVLQLSRKAVGEIDFKQKDKLQTQIAKFISFMRMYQPVDLVTSLRKENETFKQLIYVLVDYLQNTGQIIKYWVPQFEDTDDQFKSVIDGWHKNYLVTVMENETLQFLLRFKAANIQLPFKFETPAHVIEREKQKKLRLTQLKDENLSNNNNNNDIFNLSGEFKNQDVRSNGSFSNEGVNKDNVDLKTQRSNRGIKDEQRNTSNSMRQSRQNSNQQNQDNKQSDQKSQRNNNNQQIQSSKFNQQKKPVQGQNVNTNQKNQINSSKESNTGNKNQAHDLLPPKKRQLHRENSKSLIDTGKDQDKKKQKSNASPQSALLKQIKLPQDIIQTLCSIFDQKFDKLTLEVLTLRYKTRKAELDKSEGKQVNADGDNTLTDQEWKIYCQMITNQGKQSNFMDASNLIRSFNQLMQEYFLEIQSQKSNNEASVDHPLPFKYFELVKFKNKYFQVNCDKAIDYLSQQKADSTSLQEIINLVIRLNMFVTSETSFNQQLTDLKELIRLDVLDELDKPDKGQAKILEKLYKVRESFKQIYNKDNQIGSDYQRLNPFDLKVSDVWTLVKQPYFKYSINEIGILKALTTLESNLVKITPEDNQVIITDILRYKLTDPNVVFEDYLKKKMSQFSNQVQSQPTLLSEGIQAFSSQNINNNQDTEKQQDFLVALKSINTHIHNIMSQHGQKFSDEQFQSEIVNMLSNRSSLTNQFDIAQQSAFSGSDIGSNFNNGNIQSPFGLISNRQNSNSNQLDIEKKKDQKKVDLIRQETIKTIKVLQDFVKQSVNSHKNQNLKQKQSSLIKLATLQSLTDNLHQMDQTAQAAVKNGSPQKFNKFLRRDSMNMNSITIEESSENSSQDQMDVLMRYTQGQKSTNSKKSYQIKIPGNTNNLSNFNKSISDQQKSVTKNLPPGIASQNEMVSLTPKNFTTNMNSKTQKNSKLSSPQKSNLAKLSSDKMSFNLSPAKTQKSKDQKQKRKSKADEQLDMIESYSSEEDYGFEDFQNQKERELFGGARKQLKELDNNVYLKKMKAFDQEIEKLKLAHKNKKQFIDQQTTQNNKLRNPKMSQSNIVSPTHQLFDFNAIELTKRMNQLEKNQDKLMQQMPNINIVNSNIVIDKSFIPQFLMKKLGNQSSQNIIQNLASNERQNNIKSKFIPSSRKLEQNLYDARMRAVGSQQQKKSKRYQKLYGATQSQQASPKGDFSQNFSFDNHFSQAPHQDQFEQTARFTFKHQNTQFCSQSAHGSVVGNGPFQNQNGQVYSQEGALRPKYYKNKDVISDKNIQVNGDDQRLDDRKFI